MKSQRGVNKKTQIQLSTGGDMRCSGGNRLRDAQASLFIQFIYVEKRILSVEPELRGKTGDH